MKMMQKRLKKWKYKRSVIAAVLVMVMILTVVIPMNVMGEAQIEEATTQTEQTSETTTEVKQQEMEATTEVQTNQEDTELKENEQKKETGSVKTNSTSKGEKKQQNARTQLTAFASDTSSTTITAPDWIGDITGKKNGWQIVAEKYSGREQSNKKGYDIDHDGRNDIYYQKNVVPTDVENEFLVYMGITKQMTWDELLAESDFAITTANNWHNKSIGTQTKTINGKYSTIYAGKSTSGGNNYETVVNYTRGGKVVHTYKGWYHGTTPNCANGTGFLYLKSLGVYLVASHTVDLGNGGNRLTYTIDLDAMASQHVHFSVDDIVVDSVQDKMGNYMTYEGVKDEKCDGTSNFSEDTDTLTWKPKSNGASGVQVLENGGLTGYHYNIHQLVYKVHLKVEQDGFISCAQNMNSKITDPESYKVNENAFLNCHAGTYQGKQEFQVPYVRGLLYDLEFQKVVKGSEVSIKNISFKISRQKEGSTIAEQLDKTDQATTDDEGWIKFHNLPWGTYTLNELAGKEDSFQNDYLDSDKEQGKSYTVKIGKVINGSELVNDHGSGHSVDHASDVKNMLFKYNTKGIFENTPNTAKIRIKKEVNYYDNLTSDLKTKEYTIQTSNTGKKNIYIKPSETDTELKDYGNKTDKLQHNETTKTYDLIVPKNGGEISLKEVIPEDIQDKVTFDSVQVEKTDGKSTEPGKLTEKEEGCELTILPGNDITITVTNIPVGTVKLQKVIDNYQAELSKDAFIISARSTKDGGALVNTQAVLKNNESSGVIKIKKKTTLCIDEILPKEYTMSKIATTGGGIVKGKDVTISPGEDVVIKVHNLYSGKPFFHASDMVTNLFQCGNRKE